MALPDISNYKFGKVKLPSLNTIGVRGWKVKDEKDLLFTIETDENDIKRICLETRKLAKGDEVEYNYKCPECGFEFTDVVNLTTSYKMKEFNATPVTVNENMKITFKDLDWVKSNELFKLYKNQDAKYTYYLVINSIDSITYDGQTYTEFTEDEIDKFIGELDPISMDKIYESFDEKASDFTLERKCTCLKCKAEIDVNFGDILSFLVF